MSIPASGWVPALAPTSIAIDKDGDVWACHGRTFECLSNSAEPCDLDSLRAEHGPVTLYELDDSDYHSAEASRLVDATEFDDLERLDQALALGRAAVHALLVVGAGLRSLRRPG